VRVIVDDPLPRALAGLSARAPSGLADRVVSRWTRLAGPVGDLFVVVGSGGISFVRTAESVGGDGEEFCRAYRRRFERPVLRAERAPVGLAAALRGGGGQALGYDLRPLTAFERDVLRAAQSIPSGQTRPYGWVAREIGRPRAVRAVGTALGHNPVPVLIPCHRVTRSDGSIGEYVFGSAVKERLLRAEGVDLDRVRELAARRTFYLGSDTTGVVCFPTCPHTRRAAPRHTVGFASVAEAWHAGYRPCRDCRPAPDVGA
jgi:O-6-methylguanine DNA methyltransferase